jgi:hypothetical protein
MYQLFLASFCLLSFLISGQHFTQVQYLDIYTKKVNPSFSKQNQSVNLSLVKKTDYAPEDTTVTLLAIFEVLDLREEVVGSSRSISLGSIGNIWGVGVSGGVITNIDQRQGIRTFSALDLSGVARHSLRLLNFINEHQNTEVPIALNMNIDTAMYIGVIIEPIAKNTSEIDISNISWVISIDNAEFSIDYSGGMILLKKLAFYADYLATGKKETLELIRAVE